MIGTAVGRHSEVKLAGVGFGVRNQFLQIVCRHARMRHQQFFIGGDCGNTD